MLIVDRNIANMDVAINLVMVMVIGGIIKLLYDHHVDGSREVQLAKPTLISLSHHSTSEDAWIRETIFLYIYLLSSYYFFSRLSVFIYISHLMLLG